jgi:hypothetical protein
LELAQSVSRQAHSRANKELPKAERKKYNANDADTKAAVEKLSMEKPFDPKYYPDYWLTFIYLGAPSKSPIGSLVAEAVRSSGNISLSEIRVMGSKAVRNSIDEYMSDITPPTPEVKKPKVTIEVEVKSNPLETKKRALRSLLKLYKQTGKESSPEYIGVQEQLIKIYEDEVRIN